MDVACLLVFAPAAGLQPVEATVSESDMKLVSVFAVLLEEQRGFLVHMTALTGAQSDLPVSERSHTRI